MRISERTLDGLWLAVLLGHDDTPFGTYLSLYWGLLKTF